MNLYEILRQPFSRPFLVSCRTVIILCLIYKEGTALAKSFRNQGSAELSTSHDPISHARPRPFAPAAAWCKMPRPHEWLFAPGNASWSPSEARTPYAHLTPHPSRCQGRVTGEAGCRRATEARSRCPLRRGHLETERAAWCREPRRLRGNPPRPPHDATTAPGLTARGTHRRLRAGQWGPGVDTPRERSREEAP